MLLHRAEVATALSIRRLEFLMLDLQNSQLESLEVGCLPILNSFIERMELESLLTKHLPQPSLLPGREPAIAPAKVLLVLVRNILLSRQPLYGVSQWLSTFVPSYLGLLSSDLPLFNDDRLGRHLDLLFEAPQASLLTDIVLHVIRAFDIDVSQFHQDTTTITFFGDRSRSTADDVAPHITFGYNKDHRPDLKQLVWSLVVSADSAVPIHFHLYPGNTTDDEVHQETWQTLRQLVGNPNFWYVGDSKLASSENMQFIAGEHGTFLSVLPRTRSEVTRFYDYLRTNTIPWQEVRRQPNPRNKCAADHVYEGWQSHEGSKEGYRILWFRSSQKIEHDRKSRSQRLASARRRLEQMSKHPHCYPTAEKLQKAADKVVTDLRVAEYLRPRVECSQQHRRKQVGPGRPGPSTVYQDVVEERLVLVVAENEEAVKAAACRDGLFPLITNNETATLAEVLAKYKYQPFLEKRHEQLKSVLEVAPVFLKKPERVASLLLLYYVALLVYALVERELRQRMKAANLKALNLYPEGRPARQPTADLMMASFLGLRRHRLLNEAGQLLRTFHDPLPPVALQVLRLLDIDPAHYGL
jgi:transposase